MGLKCVVSESKNTNVFAVASREEVSAVRLILSYAIACIF